MDTLGRVEQLMKERGWTKYKLAQKCGMSLSSVANMFRRGTEPTVHTLELLCEAFGITMSQFFESEDDNMLTVHLTEEQKKVFDRWTTLTAEQKELFRGFMDNMK